MMRINKRADEPLNWEEKKFSMAIIALSLLYPQTWTSIFSGIFSSKSAPDPDWDDILKDSPRFEMIDLTESIFVGGKYELNNPNTPTSTFSKVSNYVASFWGSK